MTGIGIFNETLPRQLVVENHARSGAVYRSGSLSSNMAEVRATSILASLWNAPPPPPRKPRPGERVWSIRKNGKQVDAELRGHGEWRTDLDTLTEHAKVSCTTIRNEEGRHALTRKRPHMTPASKPTT